MANLDDRTFNRSKETLILNMTKKRNNCLIKLKKFMRDKNAAYKETYERRTFELEVTSELSTKMDSLKLLETLDVLGCAGICTENHFRRCYYWGRINGLQNDYHVAYGYERDCMNGQRYYYSTDGISWLLLPKATKCGRFLSPLAINRFEGDPSIVTNVYDVNPPFPPNEDPKIYYDGPLPKELKEEDRLAATVESITEDAAIVPRGAWFKCPNGDVIGNPSFEGLRAADASNLKFYLHARPPRERWNTNLLSRPDYNYAFDFLDSIDTDVLSGCWNLQFLLGGRLAVLHSLYWHGMTFFHKLNSPHYGFLYVGHGKKNLDLPFML